MQNVERRLRNLVGVGALCSLSSAFLAALFAAASQDPPQRPTFRTEANYVRVDAYPTADGVPVRDLTQDEFEVLEDNKPQKIEQFEHIEIRASAMLDARRDPNTVAESRAMLQDPRARVFVLFLDVGHVDQINSRIISGPLVRALDNLIGPDDLVGVMTPQMSAADVTFARKTTSIRAFLDREWWGERDLNSPKDPVEQKYCGCYPPEAGEAASSCSSIARQMIARRREKLTLDSLQDLVRFLRVAREERKAILAITSGWRLFRPDSALARAVNNQIPGTPEVGVDPRTGKLSSTGKNNPFGASRYECDRDRMNLAQIDDERQFRDLLDEANRGNSSFYPINPAGLEAAVTAMGVRDIENRTSLLRTFADSTDGVAVVNTNDLAGALKRVVADLSSYYLLGYYSANAKPDGRFHAIKVRVKRLGVHVRARRGYLAATAAELTPSAGNTAPAMSAAETAEARAIDAVVSPLAGFAREMPIRMQVAAGWTPGNTAAVWAVGEVPAGPGGDDWKGGGEADVMLTIGAGATIATAHARLDPGSRSFRVALTSPQPLAAGDYTVRIRARGTAPGAIPVSDAVRVALPRAPEGVGAIFIRRGPATANREMPTADLRFRRSEQLRVEIPTAASGTVTARLLDRSGKALTVPVIAALRDEPDGSRWQTAQLALAPLAVGDYVIELAGGAGGSGEKRTLVAFRVIP